MMVEAEWLVCGVRILPRFGPSSVVEVVKLYTALSIAPSATPFVPAVVLTLAESPPRISQLPLVGGLAPPDQPI